MSIHKRASIPLHDPGLRMIIICPAAAIVSGKRKKRPKAKLPRLETHSAVDSHNRRQPSSRQASPKAVPRVAKKSLEKSAESGEALG